MHVLVTGAAGFLGRAVCQVLADHAHQVTALTRRAHRPLPGAHRQLMVDLQEHWQLQTLRLEDNVDAVCHLAALTRVRDSRADPIGYFATNVGGTVHSLEAVTGFKPIPVVLTSTSAVYQPGYSGKLDEDTETSPWSSPYAASKLAAEQAAHWWAETGAGGVTVLRFFNLAGAVDGHGDPDRTRIIPAALQAAAGHIPYLTVNGNGTATRDYTHVLDAAEAVRLALDTTRTGKTRTYNVGTGQGVSVTDIIAAAEQATGRAIPVERRQPAAEAHTLIADARRIRQDLGWEHTRSDVATLIGDAWAATSR